MYTDYFIPGYDEWKTRTPEDEYDEDEESITLECGCGRCLEEGDSYYDIDGEAYCEDCANDYLEQRLKKVGE